MSDRTSGNHGEPVKFVIHRHTGPVQSLRAFLAPGELERKLVTGEGDGGLKL